MLKQQLGDAYNQQQIEIMKNAFNLAWPALELSFRHDIRLARLARECLASKILELTSDGELDVNGIRNKALSRFPGCGVSAAEERSCLFSARGPTGGFDLPVLSSLPALG